MNYAPHDYQKRAISMMVSLPGTAQLLDPGMGKSACALAALTVLQHHKRVDAMLVIAPLRPMYLTWPNEVKKWDQFAHLKVSIIHGTPAQRIKAMAVPADVYLINPENTVWLAERMRHADVWGTPPTMLVVDESTRYKSARALRFKALKEMLPRFERQHILTGTPAPQSIEDLFAQMQIVDGGQRLGRFITYFRKSFMEPESIRVAGGRTIEVWHPRAGAALEVAARIDDVALRLKAEDYLTMPAITYNIIPVELPEDVRRTYVRLAEDLVGETAGGQLLTAATSAAAVMKMRQIVNGWAYDAEGGSVHLHDAKVEALAELVEEQQGTPLLVAVAFLHEVPAIRAALKSVLPEGTIVPYLGGGVSRTEADLTVQQWNDGKLPVLLCHPTSVAHGLNLQAGGHCAVWFGLTWSLEEHTQLVARIYRQGQTKPVVIHYLTAQGTVDEDIAKALASKADVQAAILNSLKGHLK